MPLRFMCVDQKPAIRCNEISTVRAYKTGRTQFVIFSVLSIAWVPALESNHKRVFDALLFWFWRVFDDGVMSLYMRPDRRGRSRTHTHPPTLFISHQAPASVLWSKFNSRFMIFLLLFYSDRVVHLASVVVSVENKSRLVCWVTGKRSRCKVESDLKS